ncbi:MAG: 3'(2'),5'-bisphosphate nucleotidase CysQ [Gammaproteobacteria bacterium]
MTNIADHLLDAVATVAESAGQVILEVYDTDFDVDAKADDSPITAADRRAHEVIQAGLTGLPNDWPILSEEARTVPWEVRRHWREYWLVDPLDGTKEFIQRNGQFTVNIALVRAGRPVLGVVHVPVSGVTYGGVVGQGAWRRAAGKEKQPIHVNAVAAEPVRVVGSRSHRGPDLDGYLERLGAHEVVPMGSSLKFCVVAEGNADVYPRLGPTSEWDTAAAEAVLTAAGGRVVAGSGEPMRYNKGPDLLNPWFIASGGDSRDWTRYLP